MAKAKLDVSRKKPEGYGREPSGDRGVWGQDRVSVAH